jgi:hypothetical protein
MLIGLAAAKQAAVISLVVPSFFVEPPFAVLMAEKCGDPCNWPINAPFARLCEMKENNAVG